MNRSIRFVIVVGVLLVIASGVFVVLLKELDRAGSRDGDVPVLMNPVGDVRVGEWVEWKREDGKIERQQVVAVWNYSYAVKTSARLRDGTYQEYGTGQPRSTWDLGLGQNWRMISIRPEKITVAGREWNTWRVEHESSLVGRAISWMTDEVPLGLVRRRLIRADTGRVLPRGRDAPAPVAPEKITYNYEYVAHGYDEPDEDAGPDDDEDREQK